ncbi:MULTISPECIES: hypothetical protein [unclassified Pseudoalteromonas]|uniref:hypothetical protein n=1 Tax=unclassified Pseudoalteromonas TaxID=194690 RepID=UPI0020975EF2|nr:hypothetical protein [Pseudoalteromonas sp. XMcav2-N]MCO7189508.1 hypothetical protein [Pseudoalteromonas sp. XMcav2-N]
MNTKKMTLNLHKKVIKNLDNVALNKSLTYKFAGGTGGGSNSYNGPCYTPATSQRYC